MTDSHEPARPGRVLPEVRRVLPGATLLLCRCGRSAELPDCPPGCSAGLHLSFQREQRLILCRCARSRDMPYCDGSHCRPARGLKVKWLRFWNAE